VGRTQSVGFQGRTGRQLRFSTAAQSDTHSLLVEGDVVPPSRSDAEEPQQSKDGDQADDTSDDSANNRTGVYDQLCQAGGPTRLTGSTTTAAAVVACSRTTTSDSRRCSSSRAALRDRLVTEISAPSVVIET